MRNAVFPRNLVSLQATGWYINCDLPRFVIASSSAKFICFSRRGSIFPGYSPWQSFPSHCSPTLAVSPNASREQCLLLIAPCTPGKAIPAGYGVLLEGSVHFTRASTDCTVWNCTYWRANICTWSGGLGLCVTWKQHCQGSETWALHHQQQRFQHHNLSQKP